MAEVQTITQKLALSKTRPREWIALRAKQGGHWLDYSWSEYYDKVEIAASALRRLGVASGDRVALVAESCIEWLFLDMAIMSLGAVTVPIYANQRSEEMSLILNDAGASTLILENGQQWSKWLEVRSRCSSVKTALLIHRSGDVPLDVLDWNGIINLGEKARAENPLAIAQSIATQKKSDLATIIYTSGTTGEPKGVVLTHEQLITEAANVVDAYAFSEKDSVLSFLPLAHVYARVEVMVCLYGGACVAFAESIDRVRQNLLEVRPTILVSVPRIFEKLQVAILSQAQSRPTQYKLFSWALEVGSQVSEARQKSQTLPPALLAKYLVADRFVFQRIRNKLGGNLRFCICGGAPLSADLAKFFHALGILILEGYGLTETTAGITISTPLAYRFGTVGKPTKGTELRLASDGEILIKGPTVMKEYYRRPEETAAVLIDGYFHSGDIGEIDEEGFLRITDRKKDLIKTSGGKYVAPQKLENLLKTNPLISQALIHGDQEKYVVALITLNQAELIQYAKTQQLSFQDYSTLCQHPMVRNLVRGIVADVNAQLASFETIKNFAILSEDFTIAAGELTPSLKVKRRFAREKFRAQIAALYE